uniref:CSON001249 protein n=1 Tax=Culicoides sonorensis TaxID=179676 RepID=A0A336KZU9_CULSO
MVKIALQISAQFENIEELKTCHPDYAFYVKIKCSNCGEIDEKWHDITESERVSEGDSSRNAKGVNFFIKCKLCMRESSIDIVEGSNGIYTENDVGKFKSIVSFDCRGIEPVEFSPRSGWIAKATENGQKFEDIDLSEDDWADYDEKNNQSVGITEFKSQFIKLKK